MLRERKKCFTLIISVIWLAVGCADGSDDSPPPHGGSTSDDSAKSSDADIDADTDADTDADGDGDADGEQESSEGDRYEVIPSNPFVMTAHDPFSTFAADVDTASYDVFRRDVVDGMLPRPESVRLEEYVNYFRYDYPAPAPDAEHPFLISLAAATSFLARESAILRVGIQAEEPPPFEKKPTNLVFLVDVSGSMNNDDKLHWSKGCSPKH